MFRIDKSSISYKKGDQPFVLAHAAFARNAPESLSEETEPAEAPAPLPEPVPQEPQVDPAELIAQAEAEADLLLRKAREDAANMLAQAKLEFEAQRRDGYKEGFEQGMGEGIAQGKGEGMVAFNKAISEADMLLKQALERIERERVSMLIQAERECVNLSVEIARKVLGMAVEMEETAFPALIHNALEEIQHSGRVTVRISPMEYEIFFAHNPAMLSDEARIVSIVPDPDLDTGDLVLQSDVESINAGVRAQMEQIRAAIEQLGGGA